MQFFQKSLPGKDFFMEYLLLIIGFAFLIKGADFFVEGGSSLARILRIPSAVIGLTIVAMGTSAPEASVSITAAISGNNDIAVSNIVGSNIFNILIVVGVCAAISAFKVNPDILKRDIPLNIIISLILLIFALDKKITRVEGIILLILMIGYILTMVISALKNREEESDTKEMSLLKSLILIVIGLAGVIYGGTLVVDNAVVIAGALGLSQNFIGLTIVAIGTSLPELVTSIVATGKGESGLALGNAVGSNLFNIMFILGMSASISPLNVLSESVVDMIIMTLVAIILFVFSKLGKSMSKKEGFTFIILYIMYTVYLFIR